MISRYEIARYTAQFTDLVQDKIACYPPQHTDASISATASDLQNPTWSPRNSRANEVIPSFVSRIISKK